MKKILLILILLFISVNVFAQKIQFADTSGGKTVLREVSWRYPLPVKILNFSNLLDTNNIAYLNKDNVFTGTNVFSKVFIDSLILRVYLLDTGTSIVRNILPQTTSTYNFGSNDNRWRTGFFDTLYFGSSRIFKGNGKLNLTDNLYLSANKSIDFGSGNLNISDALTYNLLIRQYDGATLDTTLYISGMDSSVTTYGNLISVSYKQKSVVTIADSVINCNLSNTFQKTLSATQRFVISNIGDGQTLNIAVTNTASNYKVTWVDPDGLTIKWADSIVPVQTIGAKTDVWTFVRIGTVIYGNVIQNF